MKTFSAFTFGLIFGIGLIISGMTLPSNVQGFLNITGNWKPALIFVMIGAIGTHVLFIRFILRQPKPLLDSKFYLPTYFEIDKKLIIGSILFGIGWGLSGYCPGPVLVTAGAQVPDAIIFVPFMIVGMYLAHKYIDRDQKVITDKD